MFGKILKHLEPQEGIFEIPVLGGAGVVMSFLALLQGLA